MKRNYILAGMAIGTVLVGLIALFSFGRVLLFDIVTAEVVSDGERMDLSYYDRKWVVELLNGKWYGERNLSCGTSDAYLVLTRENGITATLYSAFDACPYVYYAERGRYIRLSQEEYDAFCALLSNE